MKAPKRMTSSGSPTTVLKKSTDCWPVLSVTVLGVSGGLARMDTSSLAPASHETELANRSRFEGSCWSQKSLGKSASPKTTRRDLTVVGEVGVEEAGVSAGGAAVRAMLPGPWVA